MKHFLLTAIVLLGFTSCLKEDTPVLRPEAGEAVTLSVDMSANYKYQIWFDLGTESMVKTSLKTDWDIAFDSDANTNHVYLNSAKMMQAARSPLTFEATESAAGLTFRPDLSEGNPDSLAFAGWQVGDVYVIDLGTTETGSLLGYLKIELLGTNGSAIHFRYAALNGSNERTAAITKNDLYNQVAYSFNAHQSLLAEPPKTEWDIVFTQYTKMFYEPFTPYLVTGVLINPNGVEVSTDSTTAFNNITSERLTNYVFTNQLDAIGYDWKYYSLDESLFTILPEFVYLIKDTEGIYYKLHFIDFYNEQGVKGSPKFEMQRL
jgi:hypothetical protein